MLRRAWDASGQGGTYWQPCAWPKASSLIRPRIPDRRRAAAPEPVLSGNTLRRRCARSHSSTAPCEGMQRSMVCLLLLVKRTSANCMPVAVMPDNPNPDTSRCHGTVSTHCYCWCYVTADRTAIHRPSTNMQGTAVPHPLRVLSGSYPPRHRPCRRRLHPTACTQAAGGIAVGIRWMVAFSTVERDTTWQA